MRGELAQITPSSDVHVIPSPEDLGTLARVNLIAVSACSCRCAGKLSGA
ncbi:hypothetical protein D8I24_3464 (plasmid) [Cupriavidus necator H850]|nr:hypothetical protein D8I24_3464 [Cupriavidus necator H850]